jgi:AraC-like DNA-binding protein
MAAQSNDIRILRFSTDELPERDRLPMMREVHGRLTAKVDIEPAPGVPLHYRVIARALPGLTVSMFSESALTIRRTRELLADGNDDVVFAVPPTAANMLSHLGRELSPIGDAVLLSTADVLRIDVPSGSQGPLVTLSRRRLASLVPGLEDTFMLPVPMDTEALQLLTRYVRLFDDKQSLATPELRSLVVDHVYDLVALALGATRDAAAIANRRGVRAARLHAIKREILNSLNRHELSLAGLAARHRVTPRHVQMLFESDGTTFSRFLLDQRLARAHRLLSNPLLAERTISSVAYEAGFGDLSHFNRVFRRRYGETPLYARAHDTRCADRRRVRFRKILEILDAKPAPSTLQARRDWSPRPRAARANASARAGGRTDARIRANRLDLASNSLTNPVGKEVPLRRAGLVAQVVRKIAASFAFGLGVVRLSPRPGVNNNHHASVTSREAKMLDRLRLKLASGTANLSCGTGCGWELAIQVDPTATIFNFVDVDPANPGNFVEGTAIKQ